MALAELADVVWSSEDCSLLPPRCRFPPVTRPSAARRVTLKQQRRLRQTARARVVRATSAAAAALGGAFFIMPFW